MYVTVYTRDLEPITVVWLAPWAERLLTENGDIRLAAYPTTQFRPDPDPIPRYENWVVDLRGEQLRLGGARTWILIASDEKLALLLKSAFLPGQKRELHERESEARASGKAQGIAMAFDIIRRLGEGS